VGAFATGGIAWVSAAGARTEGQDLPLYPCAALGAPDPVGEAEYNAAGSSANRKLQEQGQQ